MTNKRLTFMNLSELLRLRLCARLSVRQIARSLQLSVGVVAKYVQRAEALNLTWPLPEAMNEQALMNALQPPRQTASAPCDEPDFANLQQELKRKGMTLQLLWEEYAETHDNPYSYSRFTVLYRQWSQHQKLSMRQVHVAGDKLFVDYCGPTLAVVNPDTGEVRRAQVFVAVLGASSYTYAEATWTQSRRDWLGSHVRAFEFFGGVPNAVVPDNLKSAVSKPCRYDPQLNPAYQQLAEHYGVAVLPARPYKPKDKAKAEVGVQVVERWIMMRLRHQTFFTLASVNQAIRALLASLNQRAFKARPGSRASAFIELDKPALGALPEQPYRYRDIKKARVHLDYHVEYDGHYYSVPYQLVKQEVRIVACDNTVSIEHQGQQVALHPRAYGHGHTSDPRHMAKAHRKHSQWTPQRFMTWAAKVGEHCVYVVEHQLTARPHPEHGYRACLGLLKLAKTYTPERLEAACARAKRVNAMTYKSIASILKNGLDTLPVEGDEQADLPLNHEHLRGAHYYH